MTWDGSRTLTKHTHNTQHGARTRNICSFVSPFALRFLFSSATPGSAIRFRLSAFGYGLVLGLHDGVLELGRKALWQGKGKEGFTELVIEGRVSIFWEQVLLLLLCVGDKGRAAF